MNDNLYLERGQAHLVYELNQTMEKFYVITFENTHCAMSGETVLKNEGIKIDIMPTPISITKSCGISIRVREQYINDVKNLVKLEKLKIKKIYIKENNEYNSFEI